MKNLVTLLLLATAAACSGCDRRDDPRNAPTPQPTSDATSPPADPEQPTAPVEGNAPDNGTPADPETGN